MNKNIQHIISSFLQGAITVVVEATNCDDFLNAVRYVNPNITWIDGHEVTDWLPYGCFEYFYMWVELNKDGIPVLRADGFFESEIDDFLGKTNVVWWDNV